MKAFQAAAPPPPITAIWEPAGRAALLLLLNIASPIFAALMVFHRQGIRPKGWIESENAKRAVVLNLS